MVTDENADPAAAIVLAHADPGLDVELCITGHPGEVMMAWLGWSVALGMPALPDEQDTDPPARPRASVQIEEVCPRRRRRNAIKSRRPSILMRRKVTRVGKCERHAGEREIIARN
jgi:hypothetical protein